MMSMSSLPQIDDELAELRDAALSDQSHVVEYWLNRVRSWNVDRLMQVDTWSRSPRMYRHVDSIVAVTAVMDNYGSTIATWLTSMGRDGYARERAVRLLAQDPDPMADRLLALRLDDSVPTVRAAAWQALQARMSADQNRAVIPILVRLQARVRAADALTYYGKAYAYRQQRQPWQGLLDVPDRTTRRWALSLALAQGHYSPSEAARLLNVEPDQWLAKQLAAWVMSTGDLAATVMLLRSTRPLARMTALDVVPDEALSVADLDAALFDRSSSVRASAQYRASKRGVDVGARYRRAWLDEDDARALMGAVECGVTFTSAEILRFLDDERTLVRVAGLDLLRSHDVDSVEVSRLFELLDDSSARVARRAVRLLTGHTGSWAYQQAWSVWDQASSSLRFRLWQTLRGRGGWDRVRASLAASIDSDPRLSQAGVDDLNHWLRFASARMWHDPDVQQRADLVRLVAITPGSEAVKNAVLARAVGTGATGRTSC